VAEKGLQLVACRLTSNRDGIYGPPVVNPIQPKAGRPHLKKLKLGGSWDTKEHRGAPSRGGRLARSRALRSETGLNRLERGRSVGVAPARESSGCAKKQVEAQKGFFRWGVELEWRGTALAVLLDATDQDRRGK